MTHQYIRYVCLLAFSAFVRPAYCDWTGTWSLSAFSEFGAVKNFTPGPNPTSGSAGSAPSLSFSKELGGDSDGVFSNGAVNVAGLASADAGGTHFGIFTTRVCGRYYSWIWGHQLHRIPSDSHLSRFYDVHHGHESSSDQNDFVLANQRKFDVYNQRPVFANNTARESRLRQR